MRLSLRAPIAVTLCALALTAAPAAAQPSASFSISPPTPLTLEPVTFTSTWSGSGTRDWDLDDDGEYDDHRGRSASRSFSIPGLYRVGLKVTSGMEEATLSRPVTAANRPPNPALGWFPDAPTEGQPLNLVSTSTDADGRVVDELWDLDADGAFDDAAGPSVTWTFGSAGTHAVRLRTVDDRGADAVLERAVPVASRVFGLISPFPTVRLIGTIGRRGTLVKRLVVSAPAGCTVEVRCAGPGCKRKMQRRGVAGTARTLRFRRFERRLRPRAALRVYVTKPGTIGKYSRFWFRRRRSPARRDLCLAPGTRQPVACPAS